MRLGVAIAVYNGARYLNEQLDSLRAQSRQPDRVVLCDDGSTDGSPDLIRAYIQEHGLENTYVLYQNPHNEGYTRNFYNAADLCGTDIVFFGDQDDIWESEKLARMEAAFRAKPEASLIACAHTLIDAQGRPLTSVRYRSFAGGGEMRRVSERAVVTDFCWPGMCMAMTAGFWSRARDVALSISAPHDRVLALLAASEAGFWFLDEIGVRHRRHEENSGGEEHRASMYLRRDFKKRELASSLSWLNAQIEKSDRFSADAREALEGYSKCVSLRLQALEKRSPIPLLHALLLPGRYARPRGIAADLLAIVAKR